MRLEARCARSITAQAPAARPPQGDARARAASGRCAGRSPRQSSPRALPYRLTARFPRQRGRPARPPSRSTWCLAAASGGRRPSSTGSASCPPPPRCAAARRATTTCGSASFSSRLRAARGARARRGLGGRGRGRPREPCLLLLLRPPHAGAARGRRPRGAAGRLGPHARRRRDHGREEPLALRPCARTSRSTTSGSAPPGAGSRSSSRTVSYPRPSAHELGAARECDLGIDEAAALRRAADELARGLGGSTEQNVRALLSVSEGASDDVREGRAALRGRAHRRDARGRPRRDPGRRSSTAARSSAASSGLREAFYARDVEGATRAARPRGGLRAGRPRHLCGPGRRGLAVVRHLRGPRALQPSRRARGRDVPARPGCLPRGAPDRLGLRPPPVATRRRRSRTAAPRTGARAALRTGEPAPRPVPGGRRRGTRGGRRAAPAPLARAPTPRRSGLGYLRMAQLQWQEGHVLAAQACYQLACARLGAPVLVGRAGRRGAHRATWGAPRRPRSRRSRSSARAARRGHPARAPPRRSARRCWARAAPRVDAELFGVSRDVLRSLCSVMRDDVLYGVLRSPRGRARPMSDAQRVSLWPPSFSAAIFDFDGTLGRDLAALAPGRRDLLLHARAPLRRGRLDHGWPRSALPRAPSGAWSAIGCATRWPTSWTSGTAWAPRSTRTRSGCAPAPRRTCARSGRRGYAWGSPPPNDPHVLGAMRHVDVGGALRRGGLRTPRSRAARTTPTSSLEAARGGWGAEPADCAVFEDILPGTLSAARAGMATVAVESSDPRQPAAELRRAADRWIAGWEGLLG